MLGLEGPELAVPACGLSGSVSEGWWLAADDVWDSTAACNTTAA